VARFISLVLVLLFFLAVGLLYPAQLNLWLLQAVAAAVKLTALLTQAAAVAQAAIVQALAVKARAAAEHLRARLVLPQALLTQSQ
jgi:hypothetical protein